jgi:hypothetical protein
MDGESENHRLNSLGELALVAQALSLVTFFVPAKKVTRRKAEAFDVVEDEGLSTWIPASRG